MKPDQNINKNKSIDLIIQEDIMRKKITAIVLLLIILVVGSLAGREALLLTSVEIDSDVDEIIMKQDLLCLMMAYSDFITGIYKDKNQNVYLVMKSGNHILYDDGKTKNKAEKEANPDLQDMMEQIYPLSPITELMPEDFDPGRRRVYSLLKEVYGSSREQIEANLKPVKTGYKSYLFNSNNNAGKALSSVMQELVPLTQKNQNIYNCVFPVNGTYNYRAIAGTNRLSPHAFGIAIDLNRDKRDYWKWVSREEGGKRLKAYPAEIVQVFEKHGFIWGGKWGHFDILHFEYRPELIYKAKYFKNGIQTGREWFDGVDIEKAAKYIEIIENSL